MGHVLSLSFSLFSGLGRVGLSQIKRTHVPAIGGLDKLGFACRVTRFLFVVDVEIGLKTRRRCALTRRYTRTRDRTRAGAATRRSRPASVCGITRTEASRAAVWWRPCSCTSRCPPRRTTTRRAGAAGNAPAVATPNRFRSDVPRRPGPVCRTVYRPPSKAPAPSPFRTQPVAVPPQPPPAWHFPRFASRSFLP